MPGLLTAGPATVTWHAVVVQVRVDPFAVSTDAALVALAVVYAVGLRRDPARDRASQAAIASFALGLLSLYLALGSGFAGAQHTDPSVDVAQHVLLMMVAPPLIVLGRPSRAAFPLHEAFRRRPLPGSGRRGQDRSAVRSRGVAPALRAATGVASWPLYYGSMAAYFLTAAYADSLRDAVLLDVTQVGFVAVGLLFWAGLVGSSREGFQRSSVFRLAAVIAGMPIETAVGLALVLWPRPLAAGQTLAATHAAGLLLWLASMFTSGIALAVLLVQWCIADSKRADLHDAQTQGTHDRAVADGLTPAIPMRSDAGGGHSRP